MYKKIFSPAILLTNRLSYARKFMMLWLLSVVAIAVLMYSLFVSLNRIIRPSQQQLECLVLIKAISQTVQLMQQHRGFSSALLGGNEAMRDRRAAKEREAVAAFNAMEEKLPPGLSSSEEFLRIKADWERLRKEGIHLTMVENFDVHTGLIRQMRLFHAVTADEYALSMDPEIGTFYLIDTIVNKLPDALEHFGQIRGYGTGILARKQITGQQKSKLSSLISELDSALDELNINLEKTGRHNPALQKSIRAASRDITGLAHRVTGLVESDILTGHFATPPDAFLDMATVAIDNGYAQMHGTLLPATESLIAARAAHAKYVLCTSSIIVSLLFLLVAYFSAGIYYAVTGSIQSLAHSAHAFVSGDLHVRVQISTRDELGRVGHIFNEMADGFNILLKALRESEKALSNLTAHLQTVREEEKASLAREIHDDLIGTLAAVKMDIYWLTGKLPKGEDSKPLLERLDAMSNLLDSAVGTMRNIITMLRPTILDDLGLLAALEWQAAQFSKRTGIKCKVNCTGNKNNLCKQYSVALFRIFQESLTNVARHSGASVVEVEFRCGDGMATLSVIDNGRGMAQQQGIAKDHYGMLGMTERAEHLGGEIKFDSPPGGGFSVKVAIPLPAGNQEEKE